MGRLKWKCAWTLLAASLALGGCAHDTASLAGGNMLSANLAGTGWEVEEIAGQPVIDRAQTALRFDMNGGVSGSTGCNTFTGNVTTETHRLTFSPLATTRRACEPELMAQEQRFLNAIRAAQSFSIDETGGLRLLGSDGHRLMRLSRGSP